MDPGVVTLSFRRDFIEIEPERTRRRVERKENVLFAATFIVQRVVLPVKNFPCRRLLLENRFPTLTYLYDPDGSDESV